ncbi:BED-type domain-containing protein [Citrus sinensis]|nr:BED-type domain-containing protein [Citrus sinensis]
MDLEALNMEDNSNMNDIMEDGETLMDDFLEPKSKKSKIGGGRLHDSERGSKAWPHHIKDKVNKTYDETQTKLASFRVKKKKSNMASGSGTGNTVYGSGLGLAGKFDKEDCRKTVAMYFILNEVPFREVESYGFHLLCDKLCPRFGPPSRRTLVRDIYQLYLAKKTALKNMFIAKKVMTVTVDNASANDVAVNYLKKKLKNWKGDAMILDGDCLHLRCCAHIVNLIVTEGLKEMHDSIASIRNAIMYVRSSGLRLHKFKSCVEREKIENKGLLAYDVPTRWNSTYTMLSRAIHFQKAFERLEEEEHDGPYMSFFNERKAEHIRPPTAEDWKNAEIFIEFLKFFNDVTVDFSASLSVTSNLYFHHLCTIQTQLHLYIENEDVLLSKMAAKMKIKCDKYWGSVDTINHLLIIAVVLDPRYKLNYVLFCFEQLHNPEKVEEITSNIKKLLLKLKVQKNSIDLKNEVERYLFEPSEDENDDQFDVLGWWSANSARFRTLSQIAKDVLAIPVSTVAFESAFSTGGRVVDAFRSSLTPTMVEALICSQQWLKASGMDEKYIRKFDVEALSSSFSDLELCASVEQGNYALNIV